VLDIVGDGDMLDPSPVPEGGADWPPGMGTFVRMWLGTYGAYADTTR
jgi:hypothetical protein